LDRAVAVPHAKYAHTDADCNRAIFQRVIRDFGFVHFHSPWEMSISFHAPYKSTLRSRDLTFMLFLL
jgi:hypothetical protein